MFTLPGYKIIQEMGANDWLTIYRGQRVQDQLPVIIKVLQAGTNPAGMARLMNEYMITRNLEIKGIIKPLRVEWSGLTVALILEDGGFVQLGKYFPQGSPALPDFFIVAKQLAETLGELHQHGIIHRNLRLDNIFTDAALSRVKVADFSLAAQLSRKNQAEFAPHMAGSLAYLSPEQIGRTSKIMDHRSDFYSLGVIFYELLTGQLPLQAGSHTQWVHAHMAKKPVCPEELNPHIPPAVSAIILKLLAKSAGERYQSAAGLLADLEECRQQWSQTGTIKDFSPGKKDLPGHFQLPRRLYGRQKETGVLMNVFAQVCAGQSGLFLVHGYAGTGKTVLINDTLRPLAATRKGYFVTGKSDQLQRNIPYVPFIQAFGDLMRQILTESPDKLALWKESLLRALGSSGAVIIEVIPEVALIIGPQPPVERLQLWETQSRFILVFRNFIRVFAQAEHPLVLFMDDLQWADPASLELIRYLSEEGECPYLLLVGAYRDNEVTGDHPLTDMSEKPAKGPTTIRQLILPPLGQDHTNQFIADALHCTKEQSRALARILYRKTGGNPFFLGQLLLSAHEENLLSFQAQDGSLKWDPEAIREMPLTDDVINFMLGKLQKLPEETLKVLKLAACIGNVFDLKTLSFSAMKTPGQTVADLWPAIVEGLVLLANVDKTKKTFRIADNYPVVDVATKYEFLHDRVQQAAYSLLPEAEKKEAHVLIGRLILRFTAQDLLEENVFVIMDHLNRGLDLISDPAEKLQLAEYNLLAGRKAKATTAYAAALNYFKSGTGLLPEAAGDEHHRLNFDLFLERAYCEYLCAHHDMAGQLLENLQAKATTDLERADICVAKILLHSRSERYHETLELGSAALNMLGVKLPAKPGELAFLKELLLVKWQLYNRKPQEAAVIDRRQKRVMMLLLTQAVAAYMVKPDLFAFIILKMSRISFELGDTEFLPLGYACYSFFAGSVLGDVKTSRECANIAVKQVARHEHSATSCVVYFMLGALVSHWTDHSEAGITYLQKAVDHGLESGNLLVVSYALNLIIAHKYLSGVVLDELYGECLRYHKLANRARLSYFQTLIEKLQGLSVDADISDGWERGQHGKEKAIFSLHKAASAKGILPVAKKESDVLEETEINRLTTYMILKMQACFLDGDYGSALSLADEIRPNLNAVRGFFLSAAYIFYYSLAITAGITEMSGLRRKKYRRILSKNCRQLKKWAEVCPANFLHQYLLVAAETARLDGRISEAMSWYDQALESAQENGYVQHEALAAELAGGFYAARGQHKVAQVYLGEACHAYRRWGAAHKIQLLREQYPQLPASMVFQEEETAEIIQDVVQEAGQDSSSTGDLELYAMRMAVHKMAEETDPQTLLDSFLQMAIEQAGADKGYLILEKDETLFVEAAKGSDLSGTVPETPLPLEKSSGLSRRVARYVARTLEAAVVNDAEHAGVFARDPYVLQHRALSIVCLPLLCRDIPVGVLYLENSQMAGVFTPERVKVLQFLSSQIAYIQKLQSFLEADAFAPETEQSKPALAPLTEREREVLNLIAAGMSNKEIARVLYLTINTVKTHVLKIYEKLQANRRVQAIARARELKILKDS